MSKPHVELVFAQIASQQFAQPRIVVNDQDFFGSSSHLAMITGTPLRYSQRWRAYRLLHRHTGVKTGQHARAPRMEVMSSGSAPYDSCPSSASGRGGRAGLRRSILIGIPVLLFGRASLSEPPRDPSLLDPDERIRLRRELRQAHRERMRGAAAAGGPQESTPAMPFQNEPGRSGWAHGPGHLPDAPRMRQKLEVGGQPHDPHGAPPARFTLSDEEREHLRRQLREQRAARRAGQQAPAPVKEAPEK